MTLMKTLMYLVEIWELKLTKVVALVADVKVKRSIPIPILYNDKDLCKCHPFSSDKRIHNESNNSNHCVTVEKSENQVQFLYYASSNLSLLPINPAISIIYNKQHAANLDNFSLYR